VLRIRIAQANQREVQLWIFEYMYISYLLILNLNKGKYTSRVMMKSIPIKLNCNRALSRTLLHEGCNTK